MSIEAGNILRESREQKGVSIKDVSDTLHIRVPYLQALENGRAEIIPSNVQARGFLRIYSEFLGLDPVDIIQEWDNPGSTALSKKTTPPEQITFPSSVNEGATQTSFQTTMPAADNRSGYQSSNEDGRFFSEPQIPHNSFQPIQPDPLNSNDPISRIPEQRGWAGVNTAAAPSPQQYTYTGTSPESGQHASNGPLQYGTEEPSGHNNEEQKLPDEGQKKRKEKRSLFGKKKKEPEQNNSRDPEEAAQALFNEIGNMLSYRRKFLALSLEDCEAQTLIRSIYIESMENGKFDQLPSFIQARGMLNNYASFLDLDVDGIMLKLATALQLLSQKKNRRTETKRKPAKTAGRIRKFFTPDLFVGVFVIVGIAGIIIYSAVTIAAYRRNVAEPTPDLGISLLDQILDTTRTPSFLPTESPTAAPDSQSQPLITEIEETPEESEISMSAQPVQLFITANQRTLMRVVSDGKEVFSGRTIPNNTYPFDAENLIELTVGNGDAVSVVYNQQNLGRLGKIGEVITIDFSPYMAATPTPQFSPTPTNTYEPTYTPQPETPLPTNTPTPYIP